MCPGKCVWKLHQSSKKLESQIDESLQSSSLVTAQMRHQNNCPTCLSPWELHVHPSQLFVPVCHLPVRAQQQFADHCVQLYDNIWGERSVPLKSFSDSSAHKEHSPGWSWGTLFCTVHLGLLSLFLSVLISELDWKLLEDKRQSLSVNFQTVDVIDSFCDLTWLLSL